MIGITLAGLAVVNERSSNCKRKKHQGTKFVTPLLPAPATEAALGCSKSSVQDFQAPMERVPEDVKIASTGRFVGTKAMFEPR